MLCRAFINVVYMYMYEDRSYHDVQDDTDAPDVVAEAAVGNPLQDLRCGIRGTATERLADVLHVHDPRETEVGQLEVVLAVQQNVLTLQVSARFIYLVLRLVDSLKVTLLYLCKMFRLWRYSMALASWKNMRCAFASGSAPLSLM